MNQLMMSRCDTQDGLTAMCYAAKAGDVELMTLLYTSHPWHCHVDHTSKVRV